MTTETGIYEYAKQGLALSADQPAIWFYGTSITYRELFEKIDNVADHLYALGVREGTVVTIHLPNCPQAVMAIYAVAKLGGICNMVHALIPAKGLKEDMEFAESAFLITYQSDCTQAAEKYLLADISYHMGWLYRTGFRLKNKRNKADAHSFEKLEQPCESRAVVPDSKSLSEKCAAYFHSSGTTDTPKTVMHSHRAINNLVYDAQEFFHRKSIVDEVLLEIFPYFHGTGLALNLHQFITGGATIVTMAQWNVKQAVRFIHQYGVTILIGVPRIYIDLLSVPSFTSTTIRHAYVAGDYVGAELKKAFSKRLNRDSCLYEGYGMTEIVTACFSCGQYHDRIGSSGYPIQEDCRAAVLSSDGAIRTVGDGELLVATNTMMMGYLKNQRETEEAFIFQDGVKWFRTGDIGSIDEDGYVYFLERVKNTIIHNGYNVYPAEVEKVIRSVPGVTDVCVVGVWDKKKKTQFIRAYVVPGKIKETALKEQIMVACKDRLPRFAYPRQICFMDQFPRNNMAKVDRKVLERME
ncbi:MAG: acyl--CoA ligase [Ruminococcus sp.]|nr:acyl--CoA ligase [Ruminococcus sp.]